MIDDCKRWESAAFSGLYSTRPRSLSFNRLAGATPQSIEPKMNPTLHPRRCSPITRSKCTVLDVCSTHQNEVAITVALQAAVVVGFAGNPARLGIPCPAVGQLHQSDAVCVELTVYDLLYRQPAGIVPWGNPRCGLRGAIPIQPATGGGCWQTQAR
jgi:hypothetical protein